MRFCTKCGNQNADDAKFCLSCGAPLGEANPGGDYQQQYQQPQYQQQYQQPQYQPQYSAPEAAPQGAKGRAIASLVLGICALALGWIPYLDIILLVAAIVGIVLGVQARNLIPVGGSGRGLATAGLVCSIVSVAFCAIFVIIFFASCGAIGCAACALM